MASLSKQIGKSVATGYSGTGETTAQLRAMAKKRSDAERAFGVQRVVGQNGINFNQPGFVRGAGNYVGFRIDIDLHPLQEVLSKYSTEVQRRALYNALNHESSIFFTAVKRNLAAQTGAKYGRVSKALREQKAHPQRLQYVIHAKDTAMPLRDFASTLRPGAKNPYASPWNHGQRFKGAFVVRFNNGVQIVKRIAKHRGGIKGHTGPLGVKAMYGPIIPKELIRPGEPTLDRIAKQLPTRILPRLQHELEQAAARAGFK